MTGPATPSSISRRLFLQNVSAAALAIPGISLISSMACAAPAEDKLGVALVGLGSYSEGQLAPALQETRRCRLAGIVTGTPSKATEWSQKYDIPQQNIYNYETFDRIADNPDIDIVYVVLPNSMHAEYTIRAARAGKHVICEKPMALSVAECEEMIAACDAAGRKLSIGYRMQFEPHTQEMMRLGQEQEFGALKVVEASFAIQIGDPTQWRLNRALAGGGALQDVGVYAIQGARYVTGEEPISVTAQEYKTDAVKFSEVDETMFWQFEFPGGAVANCGTSYNARINRLYASAERGWFELRPAYSYSGIQGRTSRGDMNFPQINQQAAQMDDFAECILNDTPSRVSGEEGLRDVRLIQAIYEAAETGERVHLS